MQILRETTKDFNKNICHDYVVSGGKCHAFRRRGKKRWKVFSKPLQFDERRRTFIKLKERLPSLPKQEGKKVIGSNGNIYYVQDGKCTCKGFQFRGYCKHV